MKDGKHDNITGSLQTKNGKYYVLVNLYDHNGKRTVKWVALGLDSKGSKKLQKLEWLKSLRNTTAVSRS